MEQSTGEAEKMKCNCPCSFASFSIGQFPLVDLVGHFCSFLYPWPRKKSRDSVNGDEQVWGWARG